MGNLLLMGFDLGEFCSTTADVLQFVGWILTVFKISIPLVIIAYGMFDLGKAVVAEKDDEIKNATKRLMMRALAGVAIFFVPTIVLWIFGTINDYKAARSGSFDQCQACILTPWSGCK